MDNFIKNPYSLTDQWNGNQLGDPYLFRWNGWTYLYCSSHTAHIKCWKSEDLVSFEYVGSVCDLPEIHGAYAPEITYVNGKFWMITSPVGSGHYILVSDSPEGPFTLATENFGLLIDGSFFVDNNGKCYLLRAGHQGIVLHEMTAPDTPELKGMTIHESYLEHWTEGPMIIFRHGIYYLTFTGNHLLSRGYRISYCVSDMSPKGPYRKLRNQTLLLETGDEFHALGHSSSVLGPDLDSWYIAYHSFDFRTDKPFRSLNIDRLFFNRSRMYTNATWWVQNAATKPWFISRDGSGLVKSDSGWILPQIEGPFTAEIYVQPEGKHITLTLGKYHLQIQPNHTIQLVDSKDENIHSCEYTKAVDMCAVLCVRVSWSNNHFCTWLNGLMVMDVPLSDLAGAIIVDAANIPSYAAISTTAFGSGDLTASKSIPGRFDAVHTNHTGDVVSLTDNGNEIDGVALCQNGKTEVSVNVKSSDLYILSIRTSIDKEVSFTVNGQMCRLTPSGKTDSDGLRVLRAGVVNLDEGFNTLIFENFSDKVVWDWASLTPYAEVQNCDIITNGQRELQVLQILGHKREKSLLHKSTGFTCAENHGMAFCGNEGWTDYAVDAVFNVTPETTGEISLFLRETKVSWFQSQTPDSLFGYRIRFNANGISLHRHKYDNETVCRYNMQLGAPSIHIHVTVQDNTIRLTVGGEEVFSYSDPDAFLYGRIGMEIRHEGWGIENLSVKKI